MSVYFVKGKGWRYDFTQQGIRHTKAGFKTKKEAKQAEAKEREEILNPTVLTEPETTIPTDMDFLTLCNIQLDHVKKYCSDKHYRQVKTHVRRWLKMWGGLMCSEITALMIEKQILDRSEVSVYVANKELRFLRALFNYGIKKKVVTENPANDVDFLPEEEKKKYVPPKKDLLNVINAADADTQDYLWTITLTAARMGEIKNLTWDDVNFEDRYVTLWTRKKKHGNRKYRDVPMVSKLYDILYYRYQHRDKDNPWVFWHSYWSRKLGKRVEGPYVNRNKLMALLCKKAGVKHFGYHALRHLTASMLDDLGIPIGSIQRILGHENRRTTERYLHSVGEAERRAMKKLEKVDIVSTPLPDKRGKAINKHSEYWQRKVRRPSYKTLCRDIKQLGYVGTGKKYGVSDTAVRKWKANYENKGAEIIVFKKSLTPSLTPNEKMKKGSAR